MIRALAPAKIVEIKNQTDVSLRQLTMGGAKTNTQNEKSSTPLPMPEHDSSREDPITGLRSENNSSRAKGGIFAALRRSPLVGADLNIVRPRTDGRRITLS
jgi:hypothetical protein